MEGELTRISQEIIANEETHKLLIGEAEGRFKHDLHQATSEITLLKLHIANFDLRWASLLAEKLNIAEQLD